MNDLPALTEVAELKKINKRIISLFLCLTFVVMSMLSGCSSSDTKVALEYKDANGKVTGSIDQSLLSLIIAVINYQLGADSFSDSSMWDMEIDESGTTVKDVVRAEACSYAEMLLRAEYLNDYVYGYGFSDKQQDSVDKKIDSAAERKGSKDNLKTYLSGYGSSIESLERFMVLETKLGTLQENLYSEKGPFAVTDAEVKNFFAENYNIADFVCILLTGEEKDDGTTVPMSDEEKEEKRIHAKNILNQISAGAIDFEEAMANYSEADYTSVYPDGLLIPNNGTAQGINEEVSEKVRTMAEGDVDYVETQNAIYIVKKQKMNAELYRSKTGLAENLKQALESEDFTKQLATADGAQLYKDVANSLDPSLIPAFNVDDISQ